MSAAGVVQAVLEQQPRLLLHQVPPLQLRLVLAVLHSRMETTPFLVRLPLRGEDGAANSPTVEVVVARAAVRGGPRLQVVREIRHL
jgi:hypothetical protein